MKSTFALTPKIQPQHRLKPAMLESLNILHMSSDALAAYLDEQMLSWNGVINGRLRAAISMRKPGSLSRPRFP